MFRSRWSLTAGCFVLALLVGVPLYLSSGKRTLALAQRAVHELTPYDLDLGNARLQWRPFHFSVEQLSLRYRDPTKPSLLSGQAIELSMPLSNLWNPKHDEGSFRARNLTYYLDDSASDEPIDLESLLSPLAWLPGSIALDSLHVVSQGDEVQVLPLLMVTGKRSAEGSLLISSDAYLGARRIALAATADWRTTAQGHAVDLDATLKDVDSELRLSGEIDAAGERIGYAFQLAGHYEHAGEFLRAAGITALDLEGELTVAGALRGNLRESVLDIEALELVSPGNYHLSATGRVRQGPTSSLSIEARGSARRLEALFQMPEELESLSEGTELQLELGGSPQAPALRNLAIDMRIAGNGHVKLETSEVELGSLLSTAEGADLIPVLDDVHLVAEVNDLQALLASTELELPSLPLPTATHLEGELSYRGEQVRLDESRLRLSSDLYTLDGDLSLLWNGETLSAPRVALDFQTGEDGPNAQFSGSAADLLGLRGIVLDATLDGLNAAGIARLQPELALLPPGISGRASLRLTRASEMFRFSDLDAQLFGEGGLELQARGDGRLHAEQHEADIKLTLQTSDSPAAYSALGMPLGPQTLEAQLRLRPSYATTLANARLGGTDLQIVANADLDAMALRNLRVDTYATVLHLEDVLPAESAGESKDKADAPAIDWSTLLPEWPLDVTLRAGTLRGTQSELSELSIEVATDGQLALLKHFDARYAGGELMMRGSALLGGAAPQLSLAGRGIHVPLGTLTQDLGLQQTISGDVSFRGGLVASGATARELSSTMNGHASFALNDVTVAGAAYDLLMSNLLAWLARGAGETETTFDCTLLDFDVREGIAVSDTIYVDTPRMRATGKARIDFPANQINLRVEPRSKTRTFQFPSAVRLEGALDDPRLEVSPLQAAADLSAQALLLLPSLPLKLFGLGRNGEEPRPCVAATPS
ncbi:MAG: AsmA-like C-terminal region-containing protein [Pseudomonadota bacterium]